MLRKERFALLTTMMLALGAVGAEAAGVSFDTEAQTVFITDYDTGAVLFTKNSDMHIPTASMSKMMTAYVVFQQLRKGKIAMEDELPVSERAWRTGGSKMFVPVNGRVRVDDLIRGMVIQSGNDACVVLAEGLFGSEDAFVREMNEVAQTIGLKDSHFADVSGLPSPDHYMSAHDLALLGTHLIKDFPEYYHFFSELDFTYNKIKQGNRNPLLYKNIGADGIKTGHTDEAGFGLTASVKRGERHLIVVATGMKSMKGRSQEAERIVEWAFHEFQNYPLFKAGQTVDQVEADVWLGEQTKVPLVAGADLAMTLARSQRSQMVVTVSYDGPVKAPIAKGSQIGEITVSGPDITPKKVPLVAGADVKELSGFGRIMAGLDYLIFPKKK